MTERPLKILMLAPTPYFSDRGCHVRIYEEARVLVEMGQELCLATYHLGRNMPGIRTERIINIPWYRKLTAGPSWHKPYLDVLLFFKALKLARSFHPDLIHAHLHEGALIGIFLKKIINVPLLFDCQGSLTGEIIDHGFVKNGSLLARLFAAIERFINNNSDTVITSSTPGAQELSGKWGVPQHKVTSLTDGVNTHEFVPGDKATARRMLGLPLDRAVVVFLGLLNRYQGIDHLLEVIAILKEREVKAHFLVMGFPEVEYRRKATDMGIGDMITFTGRIDYAQAPIYLAAGDMAVSPKVSLTEANGKLFNYMACALPCLVFDTPVNREILGETGRYARFADVTDFADRLDEMLADPEGLKSQGARCREKALQEHSWSAKGKKLLQIYSDLMPDRS